MEPTPGVPDGAKPMTKAELDALITEQVQKAVGPALTDALQPFTTKQASVMEEMLKASQAVEKRTKPDAEKGLMFARQARAMALGKGDPERAKFEVKRYWGDDDPIIKGLDATIKVKGLTVSNAGAAGNIVLPEYSREWIELLRNQTVVRRISRTMPMPVGSITLRKQTASGTAYYVGEATNITPSSQTVGTFNMNYKKLAALTIVSNDLLRFAGSEADAFVRDDLLAVAAIREDLAFLTGDGTASTPIGIKNWLAAGSKYNETGVTLVAIDADMTKAIRLPLQSNVTVAPDTGHWIMAPRTYFGLQTTAPATDTGYRKYADEINATRSSDAPWGRIMGYRVWVSNQVSITLSTNKSETYFVHGPSCLVGDSLNVQLDTFNGGAYHDGSAVVSGISTDETVIRLLAEHDFAMRYDAAGSLIQLVSVA